MVTAIASTGAVEAVIGAAAAAGASLGLAELQGAALVLLVQGLLVETK
jgi:hypothetical protein